MSEKLIKQVQLYKTCYQSLQNDAEIQNLTYPDKKEALIFNFDIKDVKIQFTLNTNGQNVLMKAKFPMETANDCSDFLNTWKSQTSLRITAKKRIEPYSVECKYDIILTGKPDADFVAAGYQAFEDYLHLMKNIILGTDYNWDSLRVNKDKIKQEKTQVFKRINENNNLNFNALEKQDPNEHQGAPENKEQENITYKEKKELFEIYCAEHGLPFNLTKNAIKTAQTKNHSVLDITLGFDTLEYIVAFQNRDIDKLLIKDIMKTYSNDYCTDQDYTKAHFECKVSDVMSLNEALETMDTVFNGILTDYTKQAQKENIPFPLPVEQKEDILKRVKEARKKKSLERLKQIKEQKQPAKPVETKNINANIKTTESSAQMTPPKPPKANVESPNNSYDSIIKKQEKTTEETLLEDPADMETNIGTETKKSTQNECKEKEKIVVVPNKDVQAAWEEWEEIFKVRKEQLAYREEKLNDKETDLTALAATLAKQEEDLNKREHTLRENENIVLEWDENLQNEQKEFDHKNNLYLQQKAKVEKLEKELNAKEAVLGNLNSSLTEKEQLQSKTSVAQADKERLLREQSKEIESKKQLQSAQEKILNEKAIALKEESKILKSKNEELKNRKEALIPKDYKLLKAQVEEYKNTIEQLKSENESLAISVQSTQSTLNQNEVALHNAIQELEVVREQITNTKKTCDTQISSLEAEKKMLLNEKESVIRSMSTKERFNSIKEKVTLNQLTYNNDMAHFMLENGSGNIDLRSYTIHITYTPKRMRKFEPHASKAFNNANCKLLCNKKTAWIIYQATTLDAMLENIEQLNQYFNNKGWR